VGQTGFNRTDKLGKKRPPTPVWKKALTTGGIGGFREKKSAEKHGWEKRKAENERQTAERSAEIQ